MREAADLKSLCDMQGSAKAQYDPQCQLNWTRLPFPYLSLPRLRVSTENQFLLLSVNYIYFEWNLRWYEDHFLAPQPPPYSAPESQPVWPRTTWVAAAAGPILDLGRH